MNKDVFNVAFKTLTLAKDQLQTAMQNSAKTKQIPDLPERIVIEFAFMPATLMCLETLLRAEIERRENNDSN